MAKRMFLNRERAIPNAETPSVSRADIPSTSISIPVSEKYPSGFWTRPQNLFQN